MDDDVWEEEEDEPQREALMSRGQGHYLFDDHGAKYIDCVNSTAIGESSYMGELTVWIVSTPRPKVSHHTWGS